MPASHRPTEPNGVEPQPPQRSRREAIILAVTAAVFLIFLILETLLPEISETSSPSGNITFFLLINLNLILLGLLVFLVSRNLVRLVLERRRGIFGARLRTRLVTSFVALALIPSAFLFFAAQVFLNSAFTNWFNVRIEGALEDAMEVTHSYYQFAADNAVYFARNLADEASASKLLEQSPAELVKFVATKREQLNLAGVQIIAKGGVSLARAEIDVLSREPIRQPKRALTRLLNGETTVETIRFGKADIVRVGTPIQDQAGRAAAAVIVDYFVPRNVSRKARAAGRSYEEYRRLAAMKQPIENQYILTLALITLVLIFTASWVGFQQAKRITVPLQRLEEGTREVAQGNWTHRIPAGTDEETAVLVESFNQMTADLEKINAQLNERRKYVESILANIDAGVVSLDQYGQVTTINRAAEAMLGIRLLEVRGKAWPEAFARPDLQPIQEVLHDLRSMPRRQFERQTKLSGGEQVITALITATALFDDDGVQQGVILFLENVTQLLRIQRMEAWREVARRLAHEIKNPLTPVQLSAQRLRKRYAELLDQPDGALLDECTRTIVTQVEALKRLVSEFSNFARLPAVELAPADLNAVVEEALGLFRGSHPEIDFQLACAPLPLLDLDRDAIKRVLLNMLDNAVAACQGAAGRRGSITISTIHDAERGAVRLQMADNGTGMKPEVKLRLFEPYFSTKKDGTGLGLAIVSAIVADHHALIRVFDNQPFGSRFVISFPIPQQQAARALAASA